MIVDPAATARSIRVALDVEPFDIHQTLDGGQAFLWHRAGEASYRGVLGDQIVTIGCDSDGVWASGDIASERLQAIVEDYLSANVDVEHLRSALFDEPGFGKIISQLPLIRVMRQDPWECLASFICSQNSNIPRIKQMVAAVARLGRRVGDEDWAFEFPSPKVVAEAGEEHLRSVGLGYRAKHIALTAGAVAKGVSLDDLRNVPYREAYDVLLQFYGVGPKVADCVLAYSLDKGEAFPVDVHVRRAATRLYGLDEKTKYEDVGSWARDRFREYAAWAQLYMFRDEINRR